jgi:hypothetical protein
MSITEIRELFSVASSDRSPRVWNGTARRCVVALFVLMFCLLSRRGSAQTLERWVYAPTNLLVTEQTDRLEKLMREAAGFGYTHILITDSKFSRLHELDERYFRNIERIRGVATELNLQLVPAVFPVGYSNDLLSQNPNLAEGLPVRDALFEVRDGTARVIPDPQVSLPVVTDLKAWDFVDETLKPEGKSLRVTEPRGENSRVMKTVRVSPYRHYHVSIRIRTLDFRGQPQISVIEPSTGRRLTHTNLRVGRTEDWTVCHITFNSLSNDQVHVYIGAWGATGGSMWIEDAMIEECGLLNVLRRNGTPLVVRREDNLLAILSEGQDFEEVRDPQLGTVPYAGEYDVWHESPGIRMRGPWPDGMRLRVSWYHPHIIYDGQVCGCVTEPEFRDLLKQQADGVEKIFPGTDRMMSHDEWRVQGWDESFRRTGQTPGQVAAENVRFCSRYLKTLNGSRRVLVWSDMFDPHHNAVDHYYLVNGDLSGSWEGLSKDVWIVNWNFGVREESLRFFADRGHLQILAGYYDTDAQQIGRWLETVRKHQISGVKGVMYTTWQQDYSNLKDFADVVNQYDPVLRGAVP